MNYRYILGAALALWLCGCAAIRPPVTTPPSTTSGQQASKEDRLLAEANRIADEVKAGKLNRVQAADKLNSRRLSIVGNNSIDDQVFAVYRALTVDLERGKLSQADLRSHLLIALGAARAKWRGMPPAKRPDAAFTNFLLKLYEQTPLY